MTQDKTHSRMRIIITVAALATACILSMGCSTPVYARTDSDWIPNANVGQEQTSGESVGNNNENNMNDNTVPGNVTPDNGNIGYDTADGGNTEAENTEGVNTGDTSENNENENSGDNESKDSSDNKSDSTKTEPGFTTPGNGNLGDEIKSSSGKDFYTIHTQNNNTFYMVIDHTDSTENVYMLSLIDENDLAEFLEESDDNAEKKTAAVIIPETKPQTETETAEQEKAQNQQPTSTTPLQNNLLWIILAAVAGFAGFYYFRIYKPNHEEETDDSEGMETAGDDFDTENEG